RHGPDALQHAAGEVEIAERSVEALWQARRIRLLHGVLNSRSGSSDALAGRSRGRRPAATGAKARSTHETPRFFRTRSVAARRHRPGPSPLPRPPCAGPTRSSLAPGHAQVRLARRKRLAALDHDRIAKELRGAAGPQAREEFRREHAVAN